MSTQVKSETIEEQSINTIRTLSMDAVQAANSGHPGTPMAMAPLVYCLWQRLLRFDPDNPIWMNRDRFVLSAGHASMLLYSIDRKSTRLNSSHLVISYAVFCLKKKKKNKRF